MSFSGAVRQHYLQDLARPPGSTVESVGGRSRDQYASDPTLIEGDKATDHASSEGNGRRSAQENYSFSYEASSSEDRKTKKKKMKKFRTFMNVFLGGLNKKHHSSQGAWDSENHGGQYQKAPRSCVSPSSPSSTPTSREHVGKPPTVHTEVPGLCGLYNHGNTCFMNAILQCLSNTDQLAEYFVTDQYKNDLNRQKLALRALDIQGDVTEQFAILLKCLWNCQYEPRVTSHFKEVIGKSASQYQGSSQHDAQEFFLWLLDSVHEDLNQASKKKYRPIKVSPILYVTVNLLWCLRCFIHVCSCVIQSQLVYS